MGEIGLPRFLRNILTNRFVSEPFIVLDIGTFGVKGLYVSSGEVKAFSNIQYASGDINTDGNLENSINEQGITNTCRLVLKELKRSLGRRRFTSKTILGIGGGFVHGKTLTQTYIRDYPNEEISSGEFSNIVQKVQQRNYERIRRDFKRETARSELDVYLISGVILDIKIDGFLAVNPIGYKGREVSCGLFNAYVPKSHLNIFRGIVNNLKLELVSIISEPYAVFSSLLRINASETDFVLIDIGGSTAEISIIRKGRLDDIRSLSMGGSSFTRSISENLKVSIWEAENIKMKYAEGGMGKTAIKKIEGIIMADVKLFLRGLEMVLSDLSQTTLLPPKIYLYGGGALTTLVARELGQPQWRKPLSFSARPVVVNLAPSQTGCSFYAILEKILWTVPVSIANTYIEEKKRDGDIIKSMKRSLRLIQN